MWCRNPQFRHLVCPMPRINCFASQVPPRSMEFSINPWKIGDARISFERIHAAHNNGELSASGAQLIRDENDNPVWKLAVDIAFSGNHLHMKPFVDDSVRSVVAHHYGSFGENEHLWNTFELTTDIWSSDAISTYFAYKLVERTLFHATTRLG